MPPPTKVEIQQFLNKDTLKAAMKAALLKGTDPFADREEGKRKAVLLVDESPLPANPAVQVPTELPESVEDLIDAMAEALGDILPETINKFWVVWQAAQLVTGAGVGTAVGVTSGPSAAPVTTTVTGTLTP